MSSEKPDPRDCVVCGASRAAVFIRTVHGTRTDRQIPLFACEWCFSFFNPSGYKEDDAALEADLGWNIRMIERNEGLAKALFSDIARLHPHIRSVVDIGCGIGTALKVAKEAFRLEVAGYDVNSRAVAWGRETFGLDLRTEFWNSESGRCIDLITCISCLEHVEEPRQILRDLAAVGLRDNSLVYISVPFVEVAKWSYLDDLTCREPNTPFFNGDVHVTHFSIRGLQLAMEEFGLRYFEVVKSGWFGILFSAAPRGPLKKLSAIQKQERWRTGYRKKCLDMLASSGCPMALRDFRFRYDLELDRSEKLNESIIEEKSSVSNDPRT